MARPDIVSQDVVRAALTRLAVAREIEPDPLHGTKSEVVRYVAGLQAAGQALGYAREALGDSGPQAERELVEHRLASVDAAVARQVMLVARRAGGERREAISTLNAIFRLGSAPRPALSGPYAGQWVTTTISPTIDSAGRFVARLWSPWKGKSFQADSQLGTNIWSTGMRVLGRLVWPGYGAYEPCEPGLVTAFPFRTYVGPGVPDPATEVLRIDYDSEANPRLIVRSVLDEVVQVTGNFFLGKWYHSRPDGTYRLIAFFSLQKPPS